MTELEQRFIDYLNDWHTYQEPYDDKLDVWLHRAYADVIERGKMVDWRAVYFSPSSASACPRELYLKAKKKKRDKQRPTPRQRRHASQGTVIGDWLQRELLLAERHYKNLSGNEPKFKIALKNGYPAFEDFVFKQHEMEWNGQKFSLIGTTDGIMEDTETGELVGLEIKTKQETPAKTSVKSMKEADPKHVDQVVSYGEMYGVKRWLIVYVNTAKNKWFSNPEEDVTKPDVRAFEISITEEMRSKVFDYFAYVARKVEENDPPQLRIHSWRFNGFKKACALDMTDGELSSLENQVDFDELSGMAPWKVRIAKESIEDINAIRSEYM